MVAIVLAAGFSNVLSADTIYTLKLRRRGIDILRGRAANLMAVLRVSQAMQPVPDALEQDTSLAEIIETFTAQGRDALPVVDTAGAYRGTVTSAQVEASVRDNILDATAEGLAVLTPTIRADQALEDALKVLVGNDRSGLPVVSPDGDQVAGWLTHRDILAAYSRRLQQGVDDIETQAGASGADPTPPTGHPRPLSHLQGYRVIDLELTQDRPPVGLRPRQVSWPPSSMLLGIQRDAENLPVNDETVLARGDRITLLVKAEHTRNVERIIEGIAAGGTNDNNAPTG